MQISGLTEVESLGVENRPANKVDEMRRLLGCDSLQITGRDTNKAL